MEEKEWWKEVEVDEKEESEDDILDVARRSSQRLSAQQQPRFAVRSAPNTKIPIREFSATELELAEQRSQSLKARAKTGAKVRWQKFADRRKLIDKAKLKRHKTLNLKNLQKLAIITSSSQLIEEVNEELEIEVKNIKMGNELKGLEGEKLGSVIMAHSAPVSEYFDNAESDEYTKCVQCKQKGTISKLIRCKICSLIYCYDCWIGNQNGSGLSNMSKIIEFKRMKREEEYLCIFCNQKGEGSSTNMSKKSLQTQTEFRVPAKRNTEEQEEIKQREEPNRLHKEHPTLKEEGKSEDLRKERKTGVHRGSQISESEHCNTVEGRGINGNGSFISIPNSSRSLSPISRSERNVEVEDGREIDEDGEHRGSEYGGSYPYMTYIPPTMTFIPPMSMSYTLPYYPQYPRYPYNSFPHMAALPLSPPTSNYTVPLLSDLVTNTTLTNNQHTSNNHTTNTLNHNNSPSNTQQTKKKNP